MGVVWTFFTLIYPFFPLSPSLLETARYRLKYCLKGPLNPELTNHPTNDTVKELILKAYEFVPEAYKQKFKNCRQKVIKLMLNLLEPKSNYLTGGVLVLVEEFKRVH